MLHLFIIWTCRAAGLIPVFKGDAAPQNPEHRSKWVQSVDTGGAHQPCYRGGKYSQLIGPMETGSFEEDLIDRAWRLWHHWKQIKEEMEMDL